jgi:RNA polymerase sigma-70 factor (ECF subfamily)
MRERGDEDLLLAAGGGDRDAFGILVDRHHRTVFHFIHRFLGHVDSETAEDLAQDVFLKAWKASPTFEPRAKVLTWLLRITTNTCLNHQRRTRLRRFFTLKEASETDLVDSGLGPADTLGDREKASALALAVASLPPNQRAALLLRFFHDQSYREIAATLDISVSSVESLLFRAKSTLRQKLGPKNFPQVPSDLRAKP